MIFRGFLYVVCKLGKYAPLRVDLDTHTELKTYKDLLAFLDKEWALGPAESIKYVSCSALDDDEEVDASVPASNRDLADLGATLTVRIERPVPMSDKPTIYVYRLSYNSHGVLTLLKQTGLLDDGSVELVDVDLAIGQHRQPEFAALHPSPTLPLFRDSDGTVVRDSHAILRYLTRRFPEHCGALLPTTAPARAYDNSILDWKNTKLVPAFGRLFYPKIGFRPALSTEEKTAADKELAEQLVIFEKKLLKDNDFIGGETPSLADIALGSFLPWMDAVEHPLTSALQAYFQRFNTAFPAYTDVGNGLGGYGNVHEFERRAREEFESKALELHLMRVSTNCIGPWLLLDAAGIRHDLHDVDLLRHEQKTKKFAELNPLQLVPAIRAPDGTTVFESNAILRYVCDAYPSASKYYPAPLHVRGVIDELLEWRASVLLPLVKRRNAMILFDAKFESAEAQEAHDEKIRAQLAALNERRGSKPFLVGDSPTIADIAVCTLLVTLHLSEFEFGAEFTDYFDRFFAGFPYLPTILEGDGNTGVIGFLNHLVQQRAENDAKAEAARAKAESKSKAKAGAAEEKAAGAKAAGTAGSGVGASIASNLTAIKDRAVAGISNVRQRRRKGAAAEGGEPADADAAGASKKKTKKKKSDEAKEEKKEKSDKKKEKETSDDDDEEEEEANEKSGSEKSEEEKSGGEKEVAIELDDESDEKDKKKKEKEEKKEEKKKSKRGKK